MAKSPKSPKRQAADQALVAKRRARMVSIQAALATPNPGSIPEAHPSDRDIEVEALVNLLLAKGVITQDELDAEFEATANSL